MLLHVSDEDLRLRRGWRGMRGGGGMAASPGQGGGVIGGDETGGSVGVKLAALGEAGRLAAFEKLRDLQQEGACCDVTLAIGGQHFRAHKCVCKLLILLFDIFSRARGRGGRDGGVFSPFL